MNCYKCSSEKDLSLKRVLKSGHMLFVCRACRMMDYYARKIDKPEITKQNKLPKTLKGWTKFAKDKNSQLSKKYRDNSFLEARGLL